MLFFFLFFDNTLFAAFISLSVASLRISRPSTTAKESLLTNFPSTAFFGASSFLDAPFKNITDVD